MENVRYAPPRATVRDVFRGSDLTQPVRLWPASGRLGRLRLFVWNIGLYVAFFAATLVLAMLGLRDGAFSMLAFGLLYVAYVVAASILLVQRSHDMDLSGWWALLNLIPLVFFYWQFKGGTSGDNRWGPPPEPNTAATKVVGWIAGGLLGLLIVGSIVAGGILGYASERSRVQQSTSN